MRRFSILVYLTLSFTSACIAAEDPSTDSIVAALDEALAPKSALDAPGFVFIVRRHGQTLYEAASGAADIEQARAITPDTVFHIASLSKQITAAALAHAIEDGLVVLDDPLSKWIPAAAKYESQPTIAHLVYMTSGLVEYTDIPRQSERPWSTFHYFDIDEAIAASLSADALRFEPGTQWQYSNINYMLIAQIVAKAYEKPFSVVVEDKIFKPLGMTASLINDDVTQLIPDRANAYTGRTPEVISQLNSGAQIFAREGSGYVLIRRNAPHYGGSGVMTSAADWARWHDEIISHDAFGESYWRRMFSTRKFDHDKDNDAFGLVHGNRKGRATLWYEGGDIDVSSYAITFPENGVSIFCFSNNPQKACREKVFRAADLLMENGQL